MPPAAMAAALPYLLGTAAVAGVAGTAVGIHNADKEAERLRNEEGRAGQRAADAKNAYDAKQQQATAEQAAIRTRDAQALRLRLAAGQRYGRQGTLMTGTSGQAPAAAATAGKTLLGA